MSAELLDTLFADMFGACRRWLLAYVDAKPSPSLATDSAHERLINAHHELERAMDEIERVFTPTQART